uniref:Uncharacterized protein n=1 Tax=Ditylenchus dipsaci TaxID=166011 RepID=A0A915E3V6_9BILA
MTQLNIDNLISRLLNVGEQRLTVHARYKMNRLFPNDLTDSSGDEDQVGDLLDPVQAREIQGALYAEIDQVQEEVRDEEAVIQSLPLADGPFFTAQQVHVEFLRPKSCRGRDVLGRI